MPRNLKIGLGDAGTNSIGNKADLNSSGAVAIANCGNFDAPAQGAVSFLNSQKRHIPCSIMLYSRLGQLMAESIVIRAIVREWPPRARLYGIAVLITLSYMLIGRLSNDNDSWIQVSLPLSSASLLLVSLAAAETYLYVQRVQRGQEIL